MTRLSTGLAGLEPARVCIIKPSSLGDVVHALPILPALRGLWPAARISWVVNEPFQDVLRGHADLDELIVFERGGKAVTGAGVRGLAGLLVRLGRGGYDLTIDLQGLLRSAVMTAATRARVRVGLADAREGARWFYTHHVDAPRLGLHAVDRVLRVAGELGAEISEPRFHLPIGVEDRLWAREALAAVPRPRVILNLGARWVSKRWPPGSYAELGRRAVADFGAGLIAVGASEDRPLVDALARHLAPRSLLDLCGRTRLLPLAALALEADLMVSNDTGPLHLAAAAGARVVGIYTCTSPRLTGPYGPRVATARSRVGNAPSYRRGGNRPELPADLTPDQVWLVVRRQLEESIASPGDGPDPVGMGSGRGATPCGPTN
jgi:lipopolysaccharide heptosyltransferase I